jgi:hypothetical protein
MTRDKDRGDRERFAYLSQKLDRPLPTKDGGTLRTIRDARTIHDRHRQAAGTAPAVACKIILAKADVVDVAERLSSPYSWTPSSICRRCRQNESPGRNEFGS